MRRGYIRPVVLWSASVAFTILCAFSVTCRGGMGGLGQVIYVDDDALIGGNGRSWATACKYLQDGLAAARAQGGAGSREIRLAQGVYQPDRTKVQPQGSRDRQIAFELTDHVALVGGYAGLGQLDPNHRDPAVYQTILSGDLAGNDTDGRNPGPSNLGPAGADNACHVVVITGPAILDGVTITGGHASGLPGVSDDPNSVGGGLLITGQDVTLYNCVLRANSAAQRGGAAYSSGSPSLEIVNCLMVGNVAGKAGAVLHNESSQVRLLNCTAAGNRAPDGRFLSDSTPRPARGRQPPGIRVENCILANDSNEVSNGYAALTIRYTDVMGGQAAVRDPQRALVWGPGNIGSDPCFVDPGHWDSSGTVADPNDDFFVAGDYHLKSRAGRWDPPRQAWVQDSVTSPCIDAGNPATLFEHEPLPNGARVNMGFHGGTAEASKSEYTWRFITTQGPLLAEGLGVVLPHEHIFTDLRGPTVSGYGQANAADVVRMMKPLLLEARQRGVGVLFECSGIGVGRNVPIIARVSQESGLPVVVPTGVYGRDNFAPPEHQRMTEDELTALFVKELREGIEGTGIKAGFIKIATGSGSMTALEEKFLRAAGRAAGQTGAAIASHTPASSNASRQITILESIDPAIRFIWVHAQSENNRQIHRQLAAQGAYIEFDNLGWNPGQDGMIIAAIQELLAAGYGDRILLSHDAGWYQPGQPNGGSQKGYTYLIESFLPKLKAAGVDEATIRMITETNPIRAFALRSSR
jgi:phosphotriesterase-related protein